MSPYLYFKKQAKKPTNIWAAALLGNGLPEPYALLLGHGICSDLPSSAPRPGVSVRMPWVAKKKETPNSNWLKIMMIHYLTISEAQSRLCWPLPSTLPGGLQGANAALTRCKVRRKKGPLLLPSLLLEREETFLPRNLPSKLLHLLLARLGHACSRTKMTRTGVRGSHLHFCPVGTGNRGIT